MNRARAAAAAASLLALSLYVATLAPGLIALEDTPKFQFIGRVLGTAHNPGYPLYVMVSHVFGWLPLGNLAWRINLMSAVWASAGCGLLALIVDEAVGGVLLGAAAALGLAAGAMFWSASTIAEVYTLHACLVAGMLWCLLVWRRTDRAGWFFAAIACFSLGLGHHTSIVMTGPAVAAFAIATRPRFALAPRTVALILALFALGFSQYLFVLLRTWQGAYLESSAANLRQLWDVIRGADWSGDLRPLTIGTFVRYAPEVAQTIVSEVSWPVAVAAMIGASALLVRDKALLMLVAGTLAGVLAFAALFPGQTGYFLLPAYLATWVLAAIGVRTLARAGRSNRMAGLVLTLAMVAVAIWHGAVNLDADDRSHDRFHMRYFAALVRQLPAGAALVDEDWLVDRMVLYEKFSDPEFASRGLVNRIGQTPGAVAAAHASGHEVFAFVKGTERLRLDGVDFDAAPFPLTYGSVRMFLDDQPRGTLAAMAMPAEAFATLASAHAIAAEWLASGPAAPTWSNTVIIGELGRSGEMLAQAPTNATATTSVGGGSAIGTTGTRAPRDIIVEATWQRASIRVGGREVIGSSQPVVALWDRHGAYLGAYAFGADGRMPMPDSPVSVHRLRGIRQWHVTGADVTDITADAASGHVFVRPVSASPLVFYASRRLVLAPRLFDAAIEDAPINVRELAAGSAALREALRADGWPDGSRSRLQGTHVYRIEIPPSANTRQVNFGGLPEVVLARWPGAGAPPSVYGFDLRDQLEPVDAVTARVHVARDDHQLFLANGWSSIESDDTGTGGVTTTVASDAELILPLPAAHASTIDLQLRAVSVASDVTLTVNDESLPGQMVAAGWHRYQWTIPGDAVGDGMTSIVLHASAPVQLADVSVRK